jgi:hypothetical protein
MFSRAGRSLCSLVRDHGLPEHQGGYRQAASGIHGLAQYRCEAYSAFSGPRRATFTLLSNYPGPAGAPPDWAGSSLRGYYTVAKPSGQVLDRDFGCYKPASGWIGASRRNRT